MEELENMKKEYDKFIKIAKEFIDGYKEEQKMNEIIEITEEGMYDLINELLKNNYLQEVEFLKKNDEWKVYNKAIEMLLNKYEDLKKEYINTLDKHIKSLENDKNNMLEIQKELNRLNEFVDTMTAELERYKKYYQNERNLLDNYISKDKIKEKIKDLKENDNGDDYSLINVINILKGLLEEE